MDANRTLPLQKPDRVRHAVLGRNAQAQVDMIGHRMTFHQLDSTLTTQLAQDRADLPPQPSVEDFSAVLGYDHYIILAFPPHMGQALPVVHRLLFPAHRGLPGRGSLCHF